MKQEAPTSISGSSSPSPDGLGADDRAGVWSLLMIYKYLKENSPDLMPVFVFTDKEEEGCLGAERSIRTLRLY